MPQDIVYVKGFDKDRIVSRKDFYLLNALSEKRKKENSKKQKFFAICS